MPPRKVYPRTYEYIPIQRVNELRAIATAFGFESEVKANRHSKHYHDVIVKYNKFDAERFSKSLYHKRHIEVLSSILRDAHNEFFLERSKTNFAIRNHNLWQALTVHLRDITVIPAHNDESRYVIRKKVLEDETGLTPVDDAGYVIDFSDI